MNDSTASTNTPQAQPKPPPTLRTIRSGAAFQIGGVRRVAIHTCELRIAQLPKDLLGLKLLHLSDCHFRNRWEPGFDQLAADIRELSPDMIFYTGDWVEDKFDFRGGFSVLRRFVEQLPPRLGIFSVLGNHDGDLLAPRLADLGVHVLVGEMRRLACAEGSLEVIGLPGVSRDDLTSDLLDSFPLRPHGAVRIVLSHFPDAIRRATSLQPHLFLAGHTHGGQVCLPGGTAMLTHDTLPKSLAAGLHRHEDTLLHISRGVGTSGLKLRAFCPPEMTLFELFCS